MTDVPNDLDERGRRSAEAVRALAARMTAGVEGMADLPPPRRVDRDGRRVVRSILAAAAIVGVCALGVYALTRNTGTPSVRTATPVSGSIASTELPPTTGASTASTPVGSTATTVPPPETSTSGGPPTATTTPIASTTTPPPASDGCADGDSSSARPVEELPTFMTMAPGPISVEYSLTATPTTVCPGGVVTFSITVHNSGAAAVEVFPRLVLTQMLPHIDLGSTASAVIAPDSASTIVQQLAIPRLQPGTYEVLLYGYNAGVSITVVEPPAEQSPDGTGQSTVNPTVTSFGLPDLGSVVIPLRGGGDTVAPRLLTTIPVGSGPGELVLQNGEFLTPIASLPQYLVVFEEEPFAGLTGRALLLDSEGRWLRDVALPDIAGSRVTWIGAAPIGTLFVAFSGASGSHLDAFSVTGTGLDRVQTVSITPTDDPRFEVGPGCVCETGVGPIMEIETGVPLDDTTIRVDKTVDGSTATVSVDREALLDFGRWTIIEEVDPASVASRGSGRAGNLGDGAWFSDVASDDPVTAQPFIVLLSSHGDTRWYRLGPWAINSVDSGPIVLSRTTAAGLEIAVIEVPQ